MEAVDNFIPEPVARDRQAVFDAGGGCVYDIGARDGGDGASGARGSEGGRRGGDRGDTADGEDGVYGGGDVSEDVDQGQAGTTSGCYCGE